MVGMQLQYNYTFYTNVINYVMNHAQTYAAQKNEATNKHLGNSFI